MQSAFPSSEIDQSSATLQRYLKLLVTFKGLPDNTLGRTFMEVSGYPHYENVASNILAFYFDPVAEHGLKDFLLRAFLRMAGYEGAEIGEVSIVREYPTDGGRLDLVVQCEGFSILIENKIFHWLANDLEEYSRTVARSGKSNKQLISVVLGLHPIRNEGALKGGFVSHTYGQLWSHAKSLIGEYLADANPKWVTYLLDFMETTKNLAGENMELKQTDQFFIDHHDDIEKLVEERSAFHARLRAKLENLKAMLSDREESKLLAKGAYIYSGDRLVMDFATLAGKYNLAFDLFLTPPGWELMLFGRDKNSIQFLKELVASPELRSVFDSPPIKDSKYVVQSWPLTTDLGEILCSVCEWLVKIDRAANAGFTPLSSSSQH